MQKRRLALLPHAAAALALTLGLAACGNTTPSDPALKYADAAPPVFADVTVHDPSVMKAGDTYYIVGSHMQTAKSTDLMQWEQISSSVTRASSVMPNIGIQLQETFKWAQSDTLWAGDWIYLEESGKYHMYYCACEGSSPLSALGMATADSPAGPYVNSGILLKSGMWGQPSEDGNIYDANVHPNAIDPHVFFDNEGELWMVYGSYSGGIFILAMDEATGEPEPGQGYGKHLLGGRHGQVEAPYILYHPEHDYYYLFLSYGGLDSKGGYQIRVSRSKTPDGPYEDISGQAMSQVSGSLSIFKRYGQKLFGNFEWPEAEDDLARGYVSPGHNSVFYDESNGKTYLIFHTRFPGMGEMHNVRVHELFFTEEGWPTAAPFRYAGETVNSLEPISAAEAAGAYNLIDHGKEVGSAITRSQEVVLAKDGKLSGALEGSWTAGEGNAAEITIGKKTYKGFFVWQWNESLARYDIAFTLVAEDGTSIWGARR